MQQIWFPSKSTDSQRAAFAYTPRGYENVKTKYRYYSI